MNLNDPATRERQSCLPISCPPRALSRPKAAEYVGVSPSKFDQMVEDGRMPRPKQVDRRKLWDRIALDEAFASLPTEEDDVNPWDDAI